MTYDDKNFILNCILFGLFMLMVMSEWIFAWPTQQHLMYAGVAWLIFACVSNFYVCHIDSKE
jgi:hypothetical protein